MERYYHSETHEHRTHTEYVYEKPEPVSRVVFNELAAMSAGLRASGGALLAGLLCAFGILAWNVTHAGVTVLANILAGWKRDMDAHALERHPSLGFWLRRVGQGEPTMKALPEDTSDDE